MNGKKCDRNVWYNKHIQNKVITIRKGADKMKELIKFKLILFILVWIELFAVCVYGDETLTALRNEDNISESVFSEMRYEYEETVNMETSEEINEEAAKEYIEVTTFENTETTSEEYTEITTENVILSNSLNENISMASVDLAATEETLAGSCGDNAAYTLKDTDGDGGYDKLIISGNGSTSYYGHIVLSNAPWYDYRNTIKTVIIEEGITGIGSRNFADMELTSIELPKSLKEIYNHFIIGTNDGIYNCTAENVYCYKGSWASDNINSYITPENIKYISDYISVSNKGNYTFEVTINSAGFGGNDIASLYVNNFNIIVNDAVMNLGKVQYYDDGENMIIPVAFENNSGDCSSYTFRAQIEAMAHKTPNGEAICYTSLGFNF